MLSKFGNLLIPEILVVMSACLRPSARPPVQIVGRGRGRGVPRQPDGGWRMPSFLGGKSLGAFRQLVFFLVGNCMTTIAFDKEVFFFKLSLFSKTIHFDRSEV